MAAVLDFVARTQSARALVADLKPADFVVDDPQVDAVARRVLDKARKSQVLLRKHTPTNPTRSASPALAGPSK
jgi:hypothetical protein